MNIVSVILCLGALGGMARLAFDTLGAYGTVLVNVLGTFLLGYLTRVAEKKGLPEWFYIGMSTGFIGALTTFSSFMTDTLNFLKTSPESALLYVLVNVAGGMGLCALGDLIASRFVRDTNQDPYSHGHPQNSRGNHHILPDVSLTSPSKYLRESSGTGKRGS